MHSGIRTLSVAATFGRKPLTFDPVRKFRSPRSAIPVPHLGPPSQRRLFASKGDFSAESICPNATYSVFSTLSTGRKPLLSPPESNGTDFRLVSANSVRRKPAQTGKNRNLPMIAASHASRGMFHMSKILEPTPSVCSRAWLRSFCLLGSFNPRIIAMFVKYPAAATALRGKKLLNSA